MNEAAPQASAPGRAAFAFIFVTILLDMLARGALSDRFGRRPVILISCLGLASTTS